MGTTDAEHRPAAEGSRWPPKLPTGQFAVSFRHDWIDCPGLRSIPGLCSLSELPGYWTAWRSRWPARSRETLTEPTTLGLSSTAVGLIATVYLIGEVVGALFFGRLSDRLGRRKLFMLTLGVYLGGSGLTALTLGSGPGWIAFLYATRFIAGMGIGGEYAAINSAIDELIPARYRGRIDIAVNGTYWFGAILGTLGSLILLNVFDPSLGWRLGFLIGPVLGLFILVLRRHLPESPRWQIMHGREKEAQDTIDYIEKEVATGGRSSPRSTIRRPSNSAPNAATATSRCCGCCSRPTRSGRSSAPR